MATIAAAVIAAAGSIGGGILSSKKSKGQDGFVAPLNPGFNTLLDLFGAQLKTRGKVKGVFDDPNNEGVFESDDFKDAIRQLIFDAPGLFKGEADLTQGYLESGRPAEDLERAQSALTGLLASGKELSETGFRQSAGPAYEEAVRRLKANVLPEIAEIAGQQVGISSSSFLDSSNRASADLLGEAALQQINLDESAANRRAGGLGLYNQLILSQLGLAPAFGNDLLALGTGVRNVINTQQSRPLNVFASLTGLGNSQPFGVSGFNPNGSGTTQLLEGLAGAVTQPGFADNLGAILGKIFPQGDSGTDIAFSATAGQPSGPTSGGGGGGGGGGGLGGLLGPLTGLLGLGGGN
jgi:hypothetical protein